MKFLAAVVTYNPDVVRLNENIKAIAGQVDKVVVTDNGSKDVGFLEKIGFVYDAKIIENKENKGIAYALNKAMRYAYENDYDWVITLDEDSVCPPDIIATAKKCIEQEANDIAMIVPVIHETASDELCELGTRIDKNEFQEVKKCITSAAVTNVKIWKKLHGFDNKLFIDYVDYDYAVRCVTNGYRIIRMNNVFLDHRIGNSKYRRFLWTKVRVGNHSAKRKYYIARNIIIYIRKYGKEINVFAELLRLFKVLVLIILYEEEKLRKLKAYFKGVLSGLKYKL